MPDVHVLFLALGGSRRRAVAEESAQVIAEGATATVVVTAGKAWRRDGLSPQVRVVEASSVTLRHLPMAAEQLVLFKAPQLVARIVGRGPLAGWAQRAVNSYRHRVAERVHRVLFLPLYRRVWGEVPQRALRRDVERGAPVNLLVVSDPASMPMAARLMAGYTARGAVAPVVSYSVDSVEISSLVPMRLSS